MKGKTIAITIVAVLVVLVGGIFFAGAQKGKPITADTANGKVAEIIKNNQCLSCHSATPEGVWYENFPIIGGTIEKDRTMSLNYIDLEAVVKQLEAGDQVSQVDLAKIEQSMINESMPKANYKFMHWGTGFNDEEKTIIADWAKAARAELYPNSLAAAEFANDAVQPLPDSIPYDQAKADLGMKLYHDTRLSGDNTVACATCHVLNTGGVDNLQYSEGIDGQFGGINAPTVYNAAFNTLQFWNGRAADLQAQAAGPPLNPVEMGSTDFNQIADKLKQDTALAQEFAAIYGAEGITENTITDAIAEFEKTLITPNSRFDKYLKGDKEALTAEEAEGYALFKENKCATCHVGPSMGGQTFEYVGITADYYADRGTDISADDEGRFGATENEADKYKFKTPTLRNVDLTAPYFHDGTKKTLEDAVNAMFKYQLNEPSPAKADVDKIVLFLKTLTGENKMMSYDSLGNLIK